mgnify:CR=1 FL=1
MTPAAVEPPFDQLLATAEQVAQEPGPALRAAVEQGVPAPGVGAEEVQLAFPQISRHFS